MNTLSRGILLILALLFSFPLVASEYPLESVFFVTEVELGQLQKLPAETTHQAGTALRGPEQRKAAQKKIGMDEKRSEKLAVLFDLMRIKGVGPKMAVLLHGADVKCIVHMSREDAEKLLKRVLEANRRLGVTSKLPDVPLLKNWIMQASKLKPQFRGSR